MRCRNKLNTQIVPSVRLPFDRTRLIKDVGRFPLPFLISFQKKRVDAILQSQHDSEDFNERVNYCFLCGEASFHEEIGVEDGALVHQCLFFPDEFHGDTSYCTSCVRDFHIPLQKPLDHHHLEYFAATTTFEDCIRCQFQYWTLVRMIESVWSSLGPHHRHDPRLLFRGKSFLV